MIFLTNCFVMLFSRKRKCYYEPPPYPQCATGRVLVPPHTFNNVFPVPSVIKLFAKLAQKHNVDLKHFCEDCPEYVPAICRLLDTNDQSVKCKCTINVHFLCFSCVWAVRYITYTDTLYIIHSTVRCSLLCTNLKVGRVFKVYKVILL